MSVIDILFQPIYGKMCWNVENGIGSFLTFEFGEPHVKVIKEPYLSKSKKKRVVRHAARRIVSTYGDWTLWIRYCEWHFYRNDVFIGDSESKKSDLKQIALDLEGQVLSNVKVNGSGVSIFEFDLGGRLETQPFLQENLEIEFDEQWSLFQPSGMVFTFRSDGKFNHSMGDQPSTDEWIPIDTQSD